MTTRERYINGSIEDFDDVTQEITNTTQANAFFDDFTGAGRGVGIPTSATFGDNWIKKIVGASPPPVAPVANASGGQIQFALTSTSEKQDVVLYQADNLSWDMTKGLIFSARVALNIPPSAVGVQCVFGVAAAWIDGPDNNTRYVQFGCTGNSNLLIRTQDGVTQNSIAAAQIGGTAISLDTNFHTFRIRATSQQGDLEFAFDGNRVNAVNSVAFTKTDSTAILQPYFALYKPSGTGVATMTVDSVALMSNR